MSLLLWVLDLVFVEERRPASHEQPDGFAAGVLQRVAMLAGYVDGVAGAYFMLLAPDRHHSATSDDVVDLFELSMTVRRYGMAWQQDFFGEFSTFPKGRFNDILDAFAYAPQMLRLPSSYMEEQVRRARNNAMARRVNAPYAAGYTN